MRDKNIQQAGPHSSQPVASSEYGGESEGSKQCNGDHETMTENFWTNSAPFSLAMLLCQSAPELVRLPLPSASTTERID